MKCFLGVSLGNPYYSKVNIAKYVDWARSRNNKLAFLIGDDIYKYTHSVLKNSSVKQSEKIANKMGEDMQKNISGVLENKSENFEIFRWNDIKNNYYYKLFHKIESEYLENKDFRAKMLWQIFENLKHKLEKLGVNNRTQIADEKYYNLVVYLMEEISGLITMSEEIGYPVEIYPGKDLFILQQIYSNELNNISNLLPANPQRSFLSIRL